MIKSTELFIDMEFEKLFDINTQILVDFIDSKLEEENKKFMTRK